MPQQTISVPGNRFASPLVGTNQTPDTGESWASALEKINANFTELYSSSSIPAAYTFGSSYFGLAGRGIAFGADATQDVFLEREAANVLAMRNGTNGQTLRVYSSWSGGGTNTERFEIAVSTGGTIIRNLAAGSGSARDMIMRPNANLVFQNNAGTSIFQYGASGHMLWNTDNTYDIGASAATRPRNIYAGTSITGPLRATGAAPANASATGTAGDIRYDANYVYVCVATNTWKRAAIATW